MLLRDFRMKVMVGGHSGQAAMPLEPMGIPCKPFRFPVIAEAALPQAKQPGSVKAARKALPCGTLCYIENFQAGTYPIFFAVQKPAQGEQSILSTTVRLRMKATKKAVHHDLDEA